MQLLDDSRLRELLAELRVKSTAEEAQFSLQAEYGAVAVPLVLELLPTLSDFPRRCAIDLIQSCEREQLLRISNPSVAAALIPQLKSEDDVTRDWVAVALGWLGDAAAVPALLEAREAARRSRVPLDWSEQGSIRWALTELGARTPVVPPRTAALMETNPTFKQCWPAEVYEELVVDLADAHQVLLYTQVWVWESVGGREPAFYGAEGPKYELDLELPWPALVCQARDAALAAATQLNTREGRVIRPSWIDESDRL